jgi:RNA polymerase sigma factor (sigma-70 family)
MSDTTDEYRVDLKVRNNLLLTAIENAGYKSVAEFSRACGVNQVTIGDFLNLKKAPLTKDGDFSSAAQRIGDFLGLLPEDLWSQEQLLFVLPTNKSHFNLSHKEMVLALSRHAGELLEAPDPATGLENEDRRRLIGELLDGLTPKEAKVLRLRFGIETSDEHTLEEVAGMLDVTRERIRQIEAKALRKLKNPQRRELLNAVDDRKPCVDFDAIKEAYEKAKEKP